MISVMFWGSQWAPVLVIFIVFFSDWPQELFLGAKSGHFGCHLEASGVHLGVFLVGFGAICVRKRNLQIIKNKMNDYE